MPYHLRIQRPSNGPSSGLLHPDSSDQEGNRKRVEESRESEISQVLQTSVSSSKAST